MAQGYAKKEFADPGWQDYTPAWTGASSNPVIGNGTITGRYTQIGTTVHFRVSITMGSTTTYGTGAWFVSLPVTAALSDVDLGVASAQDTPTGLRWVGTLHTNDGAKAFIQNEGGVSSGSWRDATPITWADTDELHLVGTYEAASSALINLGANDDHGSLSGLTDDDHTQYPVYTDYATWSPSYVNLTVGNGTVVARYTQVGNLVHAWYELTFGSTTTVDGSNPTVSLPVTASSSYTASRHSIGNGYILDTGTRAYDAAARLQSTTTVSLGVFAHSLTYTFHANVSATVPMTWTTGDILAFDVTYEAA